VACSSYDPYSVQLAGRTRVAREQRRRMHAGVREARRSFIDLDFTHGGPAG
jgi:hypothetical protein